MSIKIVWTEAGQILGDVEDFGDYITIESPVFLAPGQQGVQMMPVLMFTEQKKITVKTADLKFNGELFEPITELRNHYNSQFGAGIQLLTS